MAPGLPSLGTPQEFGKLSDKTMDTTETQRSDQDEKLTLSPAARTDRSEVGMVLVPAKPTAAMLAAGARAAGVSVEAAWKVYREMVLHDE